MDECPPATSTRECCMYVLKATNVKRFSFVRDLQCQWCQLGNGLRIVNGGSGQWKRLRSRMGHALDDDDDEGLSQTFMKHPSKLSQ